MKTTDFIKENFVTDAAEAHQDHEVQMARSDCYNAAKYAIELHKLLKNISEQEGLEGWVSEKITLANDYLRTVTEYLRYEQESSARSDMPTFDIGSATQTLDSVLGESATSTLEEGAFTWYLKAHGRLLSPLTSDEPYKFNSKEEAIAFAKQKYKTNWQNIVPTTYDVPDSLAGQHDPGWDGDKLKPVQEDDYDDAVAAFLSKNEPVQGKTHPPRSAERLGGSRHIAGRGEAGRGKVGRLGKSAKSEPVGKPVVTAEATGESDPLANRADYAKRHGTGQVYKKTHAGDKTGMTQAYAYDIKRTGPKGVLPEENMSRAAKGHEKYGKEGMQALAKAGREGASEKELDTIRDKHDKYDESIDEAAKKGLYYYVNKRKKAGTSRDANHPDAPSPQDWKNAAKTAKKESVAETTSSGSIATSMGGGNGFANGGPGTIARPKMKKK